jgi:hypothetical protein
MTLWVRSLSQQQFLKVYLSLGVCLLLNGLLFQSGIRTKTGCLLRWVVLGE